MPSGEPPPRPPLKVGLEACILANIRTMNHNMNIEIANRTMSDNINIKIANIRSMNHNINIDTYN